MNTCLKVGLLVLVTVLVTVLLAAGAALACEGQDCGNTTGIDQDQVAANPAPAAPAVTPHVQPGLHWMFA